MSRPSPIPNIPSSEDPQIQKLKSLLREAGVEFNLFASEQNISSAMDGVQAGLGNLADMAPTFILKTEAGFLAAVIRGDTRLVYKKIKMKLGLKDVSMASPQQVLDLTCAEVGYVSLVNPGIPTLIDSRVAAMVRIHGGCGLPNHTLVLNGADLVCVTGGRVFDFAGPRGE